MVIYIHGEDTFRSRQYLKDQVEKFKIARDPQGYNVVFVDGAKAEPGKVFSEILSAPFLAEKRMVVIENVLASSDKELLGELIGRVSGCHSERSEESLKVRSRRDPSVPQDDSVTKRVGFPENNIIVFYQSEALGKVKEVKELDALLKKEKYTKEFPLLTGAQLYKWAEDEIKARGGSIGKHALAYLCDNVNSDMWYLNTLINQLTAYTQKEVQLTDVQLFLEEKIDDNIFNLTDAIIAGNHKLAFKLLAGQRKLGAEDAQIFGAILWQFRALMSMRDLYERQDMRSDEMAKVLKLHPFVVKKNLSIVKKYTTEKLKKVYADLLDIDIKTKTGFAEQSVLMDLFVGKI